MKIRVPSDTWAGSEVHPARSRTSPLAPSRVRVRPATMPFYLTDTEWIMTVVAAIYLFECACWVRRDTLCLSTFFRRFRALHSPPFMGNERMKLVIGNPSPLARSFLCEAWPIAVSPEGICFPEGMWRDSNGTSGRYIAFDDICRAVSAVEKRVVINDGPIADCSSEAQARQLAAMLGDIGAASPADRGKLIGEHLDRWTDNAAAAERFVELKDLVATLRSSGFTLFVMAFVIGPALYFAPLRLAWPAVTLYFVFLVTVWMLAAWDYSVCRKKLLGESFSQRFRHVGMLLLSPAGAMRSSEVLLRNGLAAYHPLAVAAALCTKDRLAELARPILLAVEHPKPGELPGEPEARRVDEWHRKKLLKRLIALVRRAEIDLEELLRPPEPLYDSHSYCPRCRNQYVLAEGSCTDCGGLPLVAYAEMSKPAKASHDAV
jgi:hypothetical protein